MNNICILCKDSSSASYMSSSSDVKGLQGEAPSQLEQQVDLEFFIPCLPFPLKSQFFKH